MEIRRIEKENYIEFRLLMKTVVESLPNKEWLITPSDEELKMIFENADVDYWGLFENGKLLAISSLAYDKSDFYDILQLLNIEENNVAEIAECMTLPEARGNNYMWKINKKLVEIAKSRGIEYLIATAHPDNVASNVSLKKLGMTAEGQIFRYGKYFRNYFVVKL